MGLSVAGRGVKEAVRMREGMGGVIGEEGGRSGSMREEG